MLGAIAVLIYVLSTRIRQERRPAAAAIAWVMGLALMPYLMLPLYLAFGRRKTRGAPPAAVMPASGRVHWAAALLNSFGLTPPSPTQVSFHEDGAQARDALWALLDGAGERLDICTFLIGDDPLGHEALQRLTQKARNGVKVRLLLDGFGVWGAPRKQLRALKAAGAHVQIFRPVLALRAEGPRNLRNHRKLAIADGTKLWAGGRNLAAEYFVGSDGVEPWVDLSFDVSGYVAIAAGAQFEADWASAQGRLPAPSALPPRLVERDFGADAQFLPSGPDQSEDTAHALLVDACYRAQHRLLAVTPYFLPDESLRTAMRLAARRGVRITLVVPERSNHRLADFVRARAMRELAGAGAEIRLLPRMTHAKAVVVDNSFALCGSINLDLRSLLLNYESAVVFYGAEEITWLANWIEALALNGAQFVPRAPGVMRDIGEGMLLTIAFQL